jgi:Phosphotransferase system mannitol/fructose-specific IIA domain (Ntr-type)
MEIKEFLAPSDVFIGIRASNKTQLLEDLCRRAASILKVEAEKITADILKREELGSTGMGGGVAIPHARIADVKKPFGLLARLKSAIEFDSIDHQPVDLVFLLLLPTAPAGEQLNALAMVARRLRDADITRNARRATDASGLYAAVVLSAK